MNERPKILYPALVVAAIAVTLLSLTGIAAITGMLPKANANPGATAPIAAASNPLDSQKPEAPKHEGQQASKTCANCGTVEGVRVVTHKGSGSGLGAVAGGVVGGVLGNQVGRGNGRTVMTLAGAGGGAYVGNEIEKSSKTTSAYQIRVRMADGTIRTLTQKEQPSVHSGDRVRVENGAVSAVL